MGIILVFEGMFQSQIIRFAANRILGCLQMDLVPTSRVYVIVILACHNRKAF